MKKQKTFTRDQAYCDVCGEESYSQISCKRCKKDICDKCKPLQGLDYDWRVYGYGRDVFYCFDCSRALTKEDDKLFLAYDAVRLLKAEDEAWAAYFKEKVAKAEGVLALLKEKEKGEKT